MSLNIRNPEIERLAAFVESSMVIEARYGAQGLRDLDRLMCRAVASKLCRSRLNRARRRARHSVSLAKGRDRAGLNYGDCFSYATAVVPGESLLAKGDDFVHTDVPFASVRTDDSLI
jgi:ribonuclease VapC